MSDWALLIPAGLLALIIALFIGKLLGRSYPFHAQETLLTQAELRFFKTLDQVIPSHHMIAPKVRLGDVIGCSDADWRRGHGPRISAKHLDFVIIERSTSRILLAIELDDRSHDRPDRRDRDDFVNRALDAAGVPLLRVPVARSYTSSDLKTLMADALA